MGIISIKNLSIYSHIGVFDFEKKDGQRFVVNVDIETSFDEAAFSDDLKDTIDYGKLCDYICSFFDGAKYDLLEKACFELGSNILHFDDRITGLELEINKPDAPIEHDFGSTACKISMKWEKVVLALGSNMGDTRANLDYAIEKLKENDAIRVIKNAEYITTKPYGNVEQDDFLNGAVFIQTFLYLNSFYKTQIARI